MIRPRASKIDGGDRLARGGGRFGEAKSRIHHQRRADYEQRVGLRHAFECAGHSFPRHGLAEEHDIGLERAGALRAVGHDELTAVAFNIHITIGRDERLRLELEALRAARGALVEGAPARALALLDRKVGGFRLLPLEAGIVRVEALRAAGDTSAARSLAAALLSQAGSGPYAQRLQSLASD